MAEMTPQMLGYAAGFLTTVAFVPQVLQVYRSRSARDVSLGMFVLFSTGVVLWLVYGVWIESPPVIWANAVTLVLALAVLGAKWRWPG